MPEGLDCYEDKTYFTQWLMATVAMVMYHTPGVLSRDPADKRKNEDKVYAVVHRLMAKHNPFKQPAIHPNADLQEITKTVIGHCSDIIQGFDEEDIPF